MSRRNDAPLVSWNRRKVALVLPFPGNAGEYADDLIIRIDETREGIEWKDCNRAVHGILVELCSEFEQTDTGYALAKALEAYDKALADDEAARAKGGI